MKHTWTWTAYDCHKLNSDCARCPIPTWGLQIKCRVKECLPDLVERLGAPKIYFRKEGELGVRGEKEMDSITYHEKIITYLTQHPGVTVADIAQAFTPPIPGKIIRPILQKAYHLGLLDRQQEYTPGTGSASKTYRYWPL